MKYIFMVNKFSLKERLGKYVNTIKKVADELNLDYKIEINDDNNSTEDILKKYKKTDYVIYAVGGDGILNRVLNSIYGTKNKIGCIPAGTGNDFNRSINDYFEDGDNKVDVIKCNDRYFVNVACFGIDADIANDESVVHNKFIPRPIQYKVGIFKHFITYKPYKFTMKWDKETRVVDLSLVTVCNGGYYGGGFHVNDDGIYNDGLLDAFIISATNRRQLFSYLVKLVKGKHKESKYVEHVRTNKFTIITEQPIEGNLDGEALKTNKFEMTVIPKAITFYHNKELAEKIRERVKK